MLFFASKLFGGGFVVSNRCSPEQASPNCHVPGAPFMAKRCIIIADVVQMDHCFPQRVHPKRGQGTCVSSLWCSRATTNEDDRSRVVLIRAGVSYLEAQDLGLDQAEGTTVDLNQTTASLHHKNKTMSVRDIIFAMDACRQRGCSLECLWVGSSRTNLAVGDGSSRLLLAEALHALCRRRHDC